MTDFSDFGCLNLVKIHKSIFSKNNIQIKSENIFYKRFFKAQYTYDIFSLVSEFTLKLPVEIFAYLISKRIVKLYLLWEESCFSGTIVFS